MKIFWLLWVPAIGLEWASCPLCPAAEPDAAVSAILAKWEKASQECRSLDAKLTVFHYDLVFGSEPRIRQGRFYYEAPNIGRCEIEESTRGPKNDWSHLSESIIWQDNASLLIDGRTLTCRRLPTEDLQALLDLPQSTNKGFLRQFLTRFVHKIQNPEQYVPLVVGVHAAEVRDRFDLTMERGDKGIVLKAIPKHTADKAVYGEIDVMLDAKSYLAYATRVISPSRKDITVWVLDDQRVNERPNDRDPFVNPDLSGLRVVTMP